MKLEEFLNKEGEKRELEFLRAGKEETTTVKNSSYLKHVAKLTWLIALLNDKYDVEEKGEEVFLVEKVIKE